MTDKQLQKLTNSVIDKKNSYYSVLQKLEEEYKRRFGYFPSDINDDWFIDNFHTKQGNNPDAKKMKKQAEFSIEIHKSNNYEQ